MMRTLSRDPFARVSFVRRVADRALTSCAWCGAARKGSTLAHYGQPEVRTLYQYGQEPDTGSTYWAPRAFCSIGCARAYGLGGGAS